MKELDALEEDPLNVEETINIEGDEIDPRNLSQEVVSELVEIGAIDRSEEDQFEKRQTLQQMTPTKEANTNGLSKKLSRWSTYARSTISRCWRGLTIVNDDTGNPQPIRFAKGVAQKKSHATITDITPKENKGMISIDVKKERKPRKQDVRKMDRETVRLNTDSEQYSNLLAYFRTDDPNDLKGKKIPQEMDSEGLVTPHNVSLFGRFRYNSYRVATHLKRVFFWDSARKKHGIEGSITAFARTVLPLVAFLGTLFALLSIFVSNQFTFAFFASLTLLFIPIIYGLTHITLYISGAILQPNPEKYGLE
jgi:hypothetical protein